MPMETLPLSALVAQAALVGSLHTLAGPDHYVPFVAMAKAGKFSLRRLSALVLVCGLGHCLSSLALALAAVWLGREATAMDGVQEWRKDLAAWILIGFGGWLIARGIRRRNHAHPALETTGAPSRPKLFWGLFIVFVLGPCEWLIPNCVLAAATHGERAIWPITFVFTAATMATMLVATLVLAMGISRARAHWMERNAMWVAGASCALSGFAVLAGL